MPCSTPRSIGIRKGNVILYAPTIKAVESIAERMGKQGIPIVPYHGKMDAAQRQRNQELWMSGEKRVLVGTLAFGLGINQPATRAVIHLALPKSIEQFYQEAGRAGRDGEPADCVLLWQKRDIGLLTHFVQQLQDPVNASAPGSAITRCAVSSSSRAAAIGRSACISERRRSGRLAVSCDVCGVTLDWTTKKYTPAPRVKAVRAAAAVALPASDTPAGSLHEKLRAWRRDLAKQQSMPAYVILHDSTLDALCRQRPRDLAELLEVPGIGERKAERFGAKILELIASA